MTFSIFSQTVINVFSVKFTSALASDLQKILNV